MEGNIIEEIINRKMISLRAFSKQIGFNPSVVSRVKNREQRMSYRMAFKISQVFGYDLDTILKVEKIN